MNLYKRGSTTLTHTRPTGFSTILYGADYYPEHWEASVRNGDPDLMAAAGFNVVRMGEFAWNVTEPREGKYDFSLFDDIIERLGKKGVMSILCTPTATPPRWLTKKHPGMERVCEDGVPMQHGSRQHVCYGNTTFRQYSKKITRALARHYAGNPYVIGWQTDNEINCHMPQCHCAACQKNFRAFLEQRYESIGKLNKAWGTPFWNQQYGAFNDIVTPRPFRPSVPNPAQVLDYCRFISDTVTAFQHDQVTILRKANPAWFVTHNGTFPHIDYQGQFGQDLDFMGLDLYPMGNPDPVSRPHTQAFRIDRTRSIAGNFIAMEHQVGPTSNGFRMGDEPVPGELRRMVYTSLSRGVDGLMYFRWRRCRYGAEMYHGAVLGHDNVPRRIYEEASGIGAELKKLSKVLPGTHLEPEVAFPAHDQMVNDSYGSQPMRLPDPDMGVARVVHREFYARNYAVGCVHPADSLKGVKLYIIPHWTWFDPAWVPALDTYVKDGGVLVIGALTATRTVDNGMTAQTPPGCLAELAGVTVDESGAQNGGPVPFHEMVVGSNKVATNYWYETLEPDTGTTVIAWWRSGHLKGSPAVTRRAHGKGVVYYVGTVFDEAVTKALMPRWIQDSTVKPLWPSLPEGVTVTKRCADTNEVWFIINTTPETKRLPEVPAGKDVLTGKRVGGKKTLKGYDVLVIEA